MIKTLSCFVLMAGAAWADDGLVYSDHATTACMVGTPDNADCIGRSANQCMDDMGGSTAVMTGCLDKELQFWDARLNRLYGERMTQAKGMDAEMAELGSAVPSQASALRAMQRAWIPYRDAACDYERSKWTGGTGGSPATLACLMTLTATQSITLEPFGY